MKRDTIIIEDKAVSKQWHVLGSDCTRESLFLHPIRRGGSGCSRILLSVITTFRIDKEYHLIYIWGFQ
ncbi:hypothetical protein [Parabacteroides distasonis]|uniref:hypothetical protein n=2 Tax=Parabacteroides distasonis TaxID=823 RepID=UPI0011C399DC|nr:hypothetical protein [Parabacteroides distasonis]